VAVFVYQIEWRREVEQPLREYLLDLFGGRLAGYIGLWF